MNLQRHKAIVLSYYPLSYYYPGLKDDLASVCTSWTVTAEAHQRLGILHTTYPWSHPCLCAKR